VGKGSRLASHRGSHRISRTSDFPLRPATVTARLNLYASLAAKKVEGSLRLNKVVVDRSLYSLFRPVAQSRLGSQVNGK